MTYFRDELIQQALKLIHELKELEDVLNDISRAENAYNEICNAANIFIELRIESAQLFYVVIVISQLPPKYWDWQRPKPSLMAPAALSLAWLLPTSGAVVT